MCFMYLIPSVIHVSDCFVRLIFIKVHVGKYTYMKSQELTVRMKKIYLCWIV